MSRWILVIMVNSEVPYQEVRTRFTLITYQFYDCCLIKRIALFFSEVIFLGAMMRRNQSLPPNKQIRSTILPQQLRSR